MKTGDIVLIPFPFAELTNVKVRPALVISETKDKYRDIIVCAISSIVPEKLTEYEILIKPDKINKLRVISIIKADRIVTIKKEHVITELGYVTENILKNFKSVFKKLVE